ncbi:MAG: hypothetical protein DRG69_09430 [Deltaproteobacteria bacterium]|nr:MAG: hypothetical protein DRG69_09430 [Deltaproteobacteria bacterium]
MLLDAPCSSEARFFVKDPRTYSYWKPRKVKEMSHKQKRLLVAALRVLKKGGILVYSTCTFSPEENEEVINYVWERYKDKIELEEIKLPLKNKKRGLLHWKGRKFNICVRKTFRIIPNNIFEGFFVARIRKVDSFV